MPNFWDLCRLDPSFLDELEASQEGLNVNNNNNNNNKGGNLLLPSSPSSALPLSRQEEEKQHQQQQRQSMTGLSSSTLSTASSSTIATNTTTNTITSPTIPSTTLEKMTKNNYHQLAQSLEKAESSCRSSLEIVDQILLTVSQVSVAYDDVTGRTNNLMAKCESLLEQQHTLQHTVDTLQKTIQPLNDIEEIAMILGIPYDNSGTNANILNAHNIDPRSPEFQDLLTKLSQAIQFLRQHHHRGDLYDSAKYLHWVEKLQIRSLSLIGRAMRDLLERAHRQCKESQANSYLMANNRGGGGVGGKALLTNGSSASQQMDDAPLEASLLYSRFRGLSYRMKELIHVLLKGHLIDPAEASNPSVLQEVRVVYAQLRADLLQPFLYQAWIQALTLYRSGSQAITSPTASSSSSSMGYASSSVDLAQFIPELSAGGSNGNGNEKLSQTSQNNNQLVPHARGKISLGLAIRQAFNLLLRIITLEYQLYASLFHHESSLGEGGAGEDNGNGSSNKLTNNSNGNTVIATPRNSGVSPKVNDDGQIVENNAEILRIVEALSNSTRDLLRPLIIKEYSVDELCQLISSLTEDMKAQIATMHIPFTLQNVLVNHLSFLINDAKERLLYVAQIRLRSEVQMFEALPSQLDYPDLLLPRNAQSKHDYPTNHRQQQRVEMTEQEVGMYGSWYPPLRHTLSLLSKLYNIIDKVVFEDFSFHAIRYCIEALRTGSQAVKRRHQQNLLHGDLFLIRHLLILREQLAPFDLKLQTKERALDFTQTSQILQQLLVSPRHSESNSHGSTSGVTRDGSGGGVNAGPSATFAAFRNWRFDNLPSQLLQLAQVSSPSMTEHSVDMKKELDTAIKACCVSMKASACKLLLGPLDAFLAKVVAFIGDIPVDVQTTPKGSTADGIGEVKGDRESSGRGSNKSISLLSQEAQTLLKGQSFARADRMKEVLEQVQNLLVQRLPDFKQIMVLYIDNAVARHVLLKPIVQELLLSKKKMETVVHSCLESGPGLREADQLLQTMAYTITSDLVNA
eukprot:gene3267-3580_t